MSTRRSFLKAAGLAVASGYALPSRLAALPLADGPDIALEQWSATVYFQRDGKDWFADLDASMQALRDAGYRSYEPALDDVDLAKRLAGPLSDHDVSVRSTYVGTTLHEADKVEENIASAIARAEAAKALGARVIVTNPSPIRWGGEEDKTDAQLKTQAEALNRLGQALRERGLRLAYHNHNPEMRASAREFHHMMLATDPKNVALCLDAHWIYRGSGNSQVALFDIVRLYGDRIAEVHLRQSHDGVWSEVFGPGDVDYPRLADALLSHNVHPVLIMEQGPEKGTSHTMNAAEALRRSLAYARTVFDKFAT